MGRPRNPHPKAVRRRRRDGSIVVHYYDRTTGAKLGEEQEGAAPASGTIAALIDGYERSAKFKQKKPGTQAHYQRCLNYLREKIGDMRASSFTPAHVQMMMEELEATPRKANAVIAVLSIVFNRGRKSGAVAFNPAARPERFTMKPRAELWSHDEEDRVLRAFRPSLRLAFMLLLYTLQRPSDVIAMTKGPVVERETAGGRWRLFIVLRQQKTDELVAAPVHARLDPLLRARLEDNAGGLLLVPSPTGKPWPRRNFSRAWDHDLAIADRALRAELAQAGWAEEKIDVELASRHRQRRDLRRTGIVRMAEAGLTTPQIAALSGHKIDYCQRIIDTYLPRRTEVALAGIEAWERAMDQPAKVVSLAAFRGRIKAGDQP